MENDRVREAKRERGGGGEKKKTWLALCFKAF
jgi:hypothetical protein